MLHKFYAVTMTSVYLVTDCLGEENSHPMAEKIALKDESRVPVGAVLGGGTMIAITKQLQIYHPKGTDPTPFERKIEKVSTRWWGGNSSDIVALFTTKRKAMSCFKKTDFQPCDRRWIEDTKMVIERIGEDHPAFEVCKEDSMCLLSA